MRAPSTVSRPMVSFLLFQFNPPRLFVLVVAVFWSFLLAGGPSTFAVSAPRPLPLMIAGGCKTVWTELLTWKVSVLPALVIGEKKRTMPERLLKVCGWVSVSGIETAALGEK